MNDRIKEIEELKKSLITDGAFKLIESVYKKNPINDRNKLLSAVCEEVERRYVGDTLEYHLNQMKMNTTNEILNVIDTYLVMISIDPDLAFDEKYRQLKRKKSQQKKPIS